MMNSLKIKVCGLTSPDNRKEVELTGADLLGFIFYPSSKRYVGDLSAQKMAALFETSKTKIGVFVNEKADKISEICETCKLSFAQLHGDESPDFCRKLKDRGIKIIKVFRIGNDFDFDQTKIFESHSDFFLFDTKAQEFGGTGNKFNWQILKKYKGKTPFFLSGGIKPGDVTEILKIDHPMFYGVDLNSGFEDQPGIKNSVLLKNFIRQLYELPG